MARPVARPVRGPHSGHAGAANSDYRIPELIEFARGLLGGEDAKLRSIRETTPKLGLPPISVGPDEGRILETLARSCQAAKAVEVGTLAGYSACWLARGLPADGILHTFEFDPRHASVARANLKRAGLASRVVVHEGPALERLPEIEGEGPFDLCFIDADKENYPNYLRWAIENVRPGGLVIGDNAYLFGKLHLPPAKAGKETGKVPAMREFLRLLADPRYFSAASMIPTGEGMAVGVRA